MRALLVALAAALALALAAPALASEQHPTLAELEPELMCLVCHEPLDQSDSPFADRERVLIRSLIAKGYTKTQIKKELVAEYGEGILAAPPRAGFDLVAWWLPIVGVVGGGVLLGYGVWRWSRTRVGPLEPVLAAALDPELERRLDAELERFDG